MISANVYRNPIDQTKREQHSFHDGMTLRGITKYLNGGANEWPFPTIAVVDNKPWKRGRWNKPLSSGMVVEFKSLLKGGNGGGSRVVGGAAAILTTGMSTGLIPIGQAMQGLAGFGIGGGEMSAWGGRLVDYGSAGRLGGMPDIPGSPSALAGESGSPSYSLTARGNRRRINEPVPVIYGTMRVFPDLLAESYITNVTQDISSGVKATGSLSFQVDEDTDMLPYVLDGYTITISDGSTAKTFEFDSNSSVSGSNISVTLSDATSTMTALNTAINAAAFNVSSSISTATGALRVIALTNDNYGSAGNVAITRSGVFVWVYISGMAGGESAPQTNEQYLNLPLCIGCGYYDVDESTIKFGDSVQTYYSTVQVCDPGVTMDIIYPHVVNHTDTTGKKLITTQDQISVGNDVYETVSGVIVDFVCPGGLWSTSGTSFINNSIAVTVYAGYGIVTPGSIAFYFSIGNTGAITYTMNSRDNAKFSTLYMFSSPVDISGKQLIIDAKRGSAESATTDKADSCQVVGCKRIIATSESFADVTTMAVKVKASDTINGDIANKLSVVVSRRLPIWDGSTWSQPTATRSIAWALADILKNTVYGMGLTDSQIDLDALLALDTIWDGRGDYFDGIFDQTVTAWEALQKVARCGRAIPVFYNGKITFVRDGEKTVRSAIFTPSNMAPGSLSIAYNFRKDSEPDGVDLTYINTATWEKEHIFVGVPGLVGDPINPQTIDFFGCTDLSQATREANYMARRLGYMRKTISWQTELDGRLLMVGDMVAVAHDVPAWASSSETLAYTYGGGNTTIEMSEPVTWGAGTYYALFKKQDGSVSGPWEIDSHADSTHFVIADDIAFTPNTTLENGERTTVIVYTGTVQDVVITDIAQSGDTAVTITGVPYDARIHDTGA